MLLSLKLCWPSAAPRERQSTPKLVRRQLVDCKRRWWRCMRCECNVLLATCARLRCATYSSSIRHLTGLRRPASPSNMLALFPYRRCSSELGVCRDPACTFTRFGDCGATNQLVLCSNCSARCSVLSAFVWAAVASRGGHEGNRRPLLGHRHLTT